MLFFKRRKPVDRKSGENKKGNNQQEIKSSEKNRTANKGKRVKNRKSMNRESGLYQKSTESQKDTLDRIIRQLDEENLKESKIKEIDKRIDDRYICKVSEFVHVNLAIKDRSRKPRIYDLRVKDCARNGLGILIPPKDANLIENITIGDRLKNVAFFSPWGVTSIDGIIIHKTRINSDYYKNKESYLIGLRSSEPIKKYRPDH